VRVAPVALVMPSESSSSCRVCRAVLFDKLNTAKMHGLDMSSHVVSRRDEPSAIWALESKRQMARATCVQRPRHTVLQPPAEV